MFSAFVGSRVGDRLMFAVGKLGPVSVQLALGADHIPIIAEERPVYERPSIMTIIADPAS
jgi:hypothetical protein